MPDEGAQKVIIVGDSGDEVVVNSDGSINISGGGGGAPSGPAGGDLAGTYPDPTLSVAKQAELDGKVAKATYDANTILAADTDNTPAAVTMGASTILARLAAGNIKAASVAEIQTLLGITTPAMVQLYDNIAGGAIASWDVSGISGAYNHLQLVVQARGDTAAASTVMSLRFNNDSGGNYFGSNISSNIAAVGASESLAATSFRLTAVPAATANADYAGMTEITIPNYAGTTFRKNFTGGGGRCQATGTSNIVNEIPFGMWDSTAAITRITIFPAAGNFIAGSRLTIYGLL